MELLFSPYTHDNNQSSSLVTRKEAARKRFCVILYRFKNQSDDNDKRFLHTRHTPVTKLTIDQGASSPIYHTMYVYNTYVGLNAQE